MKKITAILLFLICSTAAYSQYRGYDEWVASVGINILDNSAFRDPVKGSERWNFKNPITIGVEYKFDDNWAINPMLSFNGIERAYESGVGWIEGDENYMSFDVNGKFYFGHYIWDNENINLYSGLGLGVFDVGPETNGSINFNIGMRFWFTPEFGARIQSLSKFAFNANDHIYANNNFIHSLEFLYRF